MPIFAGFMHATQMQACQAVSPFQKSWSKQGYSVWHLVNVNNHSLLNLATELALKFSMDKLLRPYLLS